MQTSAHLSFNPSRIPGRPTIVLVAPQGVGKTQFSKALTKRLNCTYCLDEDLLNGLPKEEGAVIAHDGALILGNAGSGGDLIITAHTQAGFQALLEALGIPLSHRPPYSTQSVSGPGPDFQWSSSRSNTPSAISGVALSSNTD